MFKCVLSSTQLLRQILEISNFQEEWWSIWAHSFHGFGPGSLGTIAKGAAGEAVYQKSSVHLRCLGVRERALESLCSL